MAIYTFYPRQPEGPALTFENHDAANDQGALAKAHEVLRQHASCAFVSVWMGDRHIGDVHEAALSGSPA